MLAIKPQCSLKDARHYFKEHLTVGDYYTQGQQVPGHWFGQGAEDLGLTGITRMDEFVRLCENLHPQTGEKLTMRQNTTRTDIGRDGQEQESSNRRVFYDFTFSPAKSVSVAALVGDDSRIVEAHEQAVNEAVRQLQSFASTRVRKNGECTDRLTGNIVAAVFQHETSRALDPHLHSHCILFNATFDPVEKKWKALQNYEILGAQKFVENVYYHELARSLVKFGYQIENKPRGDFEIKGVSPELVKKFSKRHDEIDQENARTAGTRTGKSRWQSGGDPRKHRAQGTGTKNPGHRFGKAASNLGRPDDFTGKRITSLSHHQAVGHVRCKRKYGRESRGVG
ncbi:MAG: MobF family relaxase [Limisphaerales bacterium]